MSVVYRFTPCESYLCRLLAHLLFNDSHRHSRSLQKLTHSKFLADYSAIYITVIVYLSPSRCCSFNQFRSNRYYYNVILVLMTFLIHFESLLIEYRVQNVNKSQKNEQAKYKVFFLLNYSKKSNDEQTKKNREQPAFLQFIKIILRLNKATDHLKLSILFSMQSN